MNSGCLEWAAAGWEWAEGMYEELTEGNEASRGWRKLKSFAIGNLLARFGKVGKDLLLADRDEWVCGLSGCEQLLREFHNLDSCVFRHCFQHGNSCI